MADNVTFYAQGKTQSGTFYSAGIPGSSNDELFSSTEYVDGGVIYIGQSVYEVAAGGTFTFSYSEGTVYTFDFQFLDVSTNTLYSS